MRSVMITYNQVLQREVEESLDQLGIRGFTRWVDVHGRGSFDGEPHYGTHTWPALNGAVFVVIDDDLVEPLTEILKALDEEYGGRGIRAFSWEADALF